MKISLNPQYITLEGVDLVLMSRKEYEKLKDLLEDLEDLKDLEEAKRNDNPNERVFLRDILNS